MIRKAILLVLAIAVASQSMAAKYKILRIAGSDTVTIGDNRLVVGDTFDDHDIIHWTGMNQAIKAIALDGENKGHTVTVSARACEQSKAKSLYRYSNMIGRAAAEEAKPIIVFDGESSTIDYPIDEGCTYSLWLDDTIIPIAPQEGVLTVSADLFQQAGLYEMWLTRNCDSGDEPLIQITVDVVK